MSLASWWQQNVEVPIGGLFSYNQAAGGVPSDGWAGFFYNSVLGELSPGQLKAINSSVFAECKQAGGSDSDCAKAANQAQQVGSASGGMTTFEKYAILAVVIVIAGYLFTHWPKR